MIAATGTKMLAMRLGTTGEITTDAAGALRPPPVMVGSCGVRTTEATGARLGIVGARFVNTTD
jgi:hypothetical protein